MEPLKLTINHRNKLLEMCSILFPNMNWNIENIRAHYLEESDQYIDDILKGYYHEKSEMDETADIIIHWFEFCMEICQKLAYTFPINHCAIQTNFNYVCVHYKFWNENNSKIHPIDYLYNEFKKIKS